MVQLGGGTRWHAAVAVGLFALSGPAIETFYTLSKAEPLQMLWVGLSLLAAGRLRGPATVGALPMGRPGRPSPAVRSCDKGDERGAGPHLAGLARDRAVDELAAAATILPFTITYAAANVVAALAFVGLRWYYLPLALSEGGYTRAYSFTIPTVGATLFRMAAWVVRDFAFLLPVAWATALILVRGRPASRRLILYAGVWMGGWLAVFLPWPATFAYYLLPFAFGAAVLGGVVVGDLTQAGRERLAGRATAAVLLAATASLWLVTVANAVVDARVQLAVDRANGDLVEFLATLPSQSQVVLNTAQPNEYLFELPLHLSEIKRRPDIVVKPVVRSVPEGQTSLPGFVATPDVANRPVPTVRLPINEGDSPHVNATLRGLLDGRGELAYQSGQRTPLLELGFHRLLCLVNVTLLVDPTYCPSDRGLVYWRTFAYRWHVHRVVARRWRWRGEWPLGSATEAGNDGSSRQTHDRHRRPRLQRGTGRGRVSRPPDEGRGALATRPRRSALLRQRRVQ